MHVWLRHVCRMLELGEGSPLQQPYHKHTAKVGTHPRHKHARAQQGRPRVTAVKKRQRQADKGGQGCARRKARGQKGGGGGVEIWTRRKDEGGSTGTLAGEWRQVAKEYQLLYCYNNCLINIAKTQQQPLKILHTTLHNTGVDSNALYNPWEHLQHNAQVVCQLLRRAGSQARHLSIQKNRVAAMASSTSPTSQTSSNSLSINPLTYSSYKNTSAHRGADTPGGVTGSTNMHQQWRCCQKGANTNWQKGNGDRW